MAPLAAALATPMAGIYLAAALLDDSWLFLCGKMIVAL